MLKELFNKSIAVIDQAIFSSISFALTIVLGRSMTLAQFGIFSSLIIVLMLASGISQAIIIQPMQSQVKTLQQNLGYAKMLFSIQLIYFVFIISAGFLAAPLLTKYINLTINDIMCFCLYTGLFICYDFIRKYFLATQNDKNCLKMDVIYGLSMGIVLISFLTFPILTLDKVFLTLIIGLFPAFSFGITVFSKNVKSKTAWGLFPKQISDGKWYFLAATTQWFSSNVFILASGVFLSLEALGALRLVQSIFGLFNILLQNVENSIIPKVNVIIESSYVETSKYINKLLKKSLIWILAIMLLTFTFSKEIITFFGGAQYQNYHEFIREFVFLYVVIFLFYPVRIVIRAKGFHKSFFIAYLLSSAVAILSCNFLFETFSMYGAILGLILGQLILFITWVISLSKKNIQIWKLYTSY